MKEIKTYITLTIDHPSLKNVTKGSKHKVHNSYRNGFDIIVKKNDIDYVMPYIQIFVPRKYCSISQEII